MPENDPVYAAAVAELAAIKSKIARMEAIARQPAPGLESAIAEHIGRPVSPDAAHRRLEAIARQFVPDPGMEDALRRRTAEGLYNYEQRQRRMGADPLELSLYSRQRDAAIAAGTWTPPEGDAS